MFKTTFQMMFAFAALCFSTQTATADEMRLSNGDILHGTLEEIDFEEGEVTFDFSSGGELTVDWDDVAFLRTDKAYSVKLYGQDPLQDLMQGTLEIEAGKIHVINGNCDKPLCVDKCSIIKICKIPKLCDPCSPEAWQGKWEAELSFGYVSLSGNEDTQTLTGQFDAEKLVTFCGDPMHRYEWESKFKWKRDSGRIKTDEGRVRLLYEHFFTNHWTGRFSEEFMWDKAEDIKLRSETAGDIGYYIWRSDDLKLEVYVGVLYDSTNYTNYPDAGPNLRSVNLDTGLEFKWKVFRYLTFYNEFEYSPIFREFDNCFIESYSKFEIPLSKSWRIILEHDWWFDSRPRLNLDAEPRLDADGNPTKELVYFKKSDQTVEVRLTYAF